MSPKSLAAGLLSTLLLAASSPSAPSVQQAPADGSGSAQEPAGAADEPAVDPAEHAFSNLAVPLYLTDEPPPARSLRHIQIFHSGIDRGPLTSRRTREQAAALAADLHRKLEDGADFVQLAERFSEAPSARFGAVLGTFPAGLLAPELDAFLFSADVGDFSEPIENEHGFHILQRVERWAGGLQIMVRTAEGGEEPARKRIAEIQQRLEEGAEFGDLAEKYSEDSFSQARRGQFLIAERGPRDVLLKGALFGAEIGEVVGPIQTPLGFHLVKRVPVSEVDEDLRENNWVRARAIVVSYDGAPGAPPLVTRTVDEAKELALELHDRIAAGEDMAAVAREVDDDAFGQERGGDLGWLYRRSPKMAAVLDRLFTSEPGHLFEPTFVSVGWLVLKRER